MNYLVLARFLIFLVEINTRYINIYTKTRKHFFFVLAYSLKHARDLVRAITKKVKNQLPASTSQRSQPALPGIGTGHVPLMLPPIKKDRWVKQVQLFRSRAGRPSFMNRLAEVERVLANSVVMTGESKQFDSELRNYSSRLLCNMFLTGCRGKNLGSQETVVLQIWQKKRKQIVIYVFPVPQTFLPLFDSANGLFCQERLLSSRNFATMVTRRRIFPFHYYLSFLLFYFAFLCFFACVLKLPIDIQISLNYIKRRRLKKETTHNYTQSGP